MNILEQIDYDLKEIEKYYGLVSETLGEQPEWSYCRGNACYNAVIDIYGCVEYWLKRICDFRMSRDSLKLSHKDIRGKNDLAGLNKYLCKVAGIEMTEVSQYYSELQSLRRVRNCIVHSGSHTENQDVGCIKGVSLAGTLIIISPTFIESNLISAKEYLSHAATA